MRFYSEELKKRRAKEGYKSINDITQISVRYSRVVIWSHNNCHWMCRDLYCIYFLFQNAFAYLLTYILMCSIRIDTRFKSSIFLFHALFISFFSIWFVLWGGVFWGDGLGRIKNCVDVNVINEIQGYQWKMWLVLIELKLNW